MPSKQHTSLQDLEGKFQNYLMHSKLDIIEHTVSTAKVPAQLRMDIYANAYRSRLHEALMASYPILEAYIGCEQFEELCYAFIDHHPSQFRSIRWFGDKLAEFMRCQAPYKDHPFLAELAQLEWTMATVFDAADDPVLQLESMANLPPDAWVNMRLQAHPTIQRLNLSWNMVQIWQAITDDEEPADPLQSEAPVAWLFWREDYMSHFASIDPDEAWAMDALLNGQTFGEICEGLCQWHAEADAGMRAASLLKGWIMAGMISGIDV